MISKARSRRPKSRSDAVAVETLYLRLLRQFYEEDNRERAEQTALQLEASLASSPEFARSIRGDEIRSLIAELRNDFAEAARCREAEIRKILELHSLAVNSPSWKYVARQYDFDDVSDRLDVLALLYDRLGDADRAVATLVESKHYCASHGIRFDGQALLDELSQSRNGAAAPRRKKKQAVRQAHAT